MKIKILVSPSYSGWVVDREYGLHECDSFEEIIKIDPKAIDRKTYSYIKALEKNKKLEDEIKKSREKLGIPKEGFSKKEYDEFLYKNTIPADPESEWITPTYTDKLKFLKLNIFKEERRIKSIFEIDPIVMSSMKYLIFHNGVYAPNKSIYLSDARHGFEP